ncbi:hypothetical protein GLYMA_16G107551v4 [Glycine max]|uniref:uncharacterized protein n=1 Tax=Glycine max TaxID=3847 RepID=UPI0007194465|nr:uncharacterized protein LOC121173653 [Glycine max]XP_040866152.1 uncharacterized protein LOC121173653 [Glycine max]KAG4380099.1 hypothetical protein GLYMA_16G107551v4 [Glycine max]KAH1150917.1 hypothetical protein GYH30_044760 [Glycine max]
MKYQENNWVAELYKKRNMWSPAHNHGNFFAAISKVFNLFRFHEVEVDYDSKVGSLGLEIDFHAIKRSGAEVITKELFMAFQSNLKTMMLRVDECQEMGMSCVYTVEVSLVRYVACFILPFKWI